MEPEPGYEKGILRKWGTVTGGVRLLSGAPWMSLSAKSEVFLPYNRRSLACPSLYLYNVYPSNAKYCRKDDGLAIVISHTSHNCSRFSRIVKHIRELWRIGVDCVRSRSRICRTGPYGNPRRRRLPVGSQSSELLKANTTASGRETRRASSDPACFPHSGKGLGMLLHDSG